MLDQDLLRAQRLAGYGTVSTQLSLLSDHRLGEAVAAATPLGSGIGGRSAELDIDGTRVFLKRIPLTDGHRITAGERAVDGERLRTADVLPVRGGLGWVRCLAGARRAHHDHELGS
ncbi:hypothetical protein QFZ49_007603 [Streptomyces turgidiscabies]|uniref:Uncharacterized protein n=1 Tax=Streptomyces turgidiscabies TaxID=85558 RepID=A0ABU0S049_9ACTN|nr:hypothetical protein [Streptomyces turgidiscabies]